MKNLSGGTAVITGAPGGIERGIALAVAGVPAHTDVRSVDRVQARHRAIEAAFARD